MSSDARQELAPSGVLRARINLSNALLVTGRSASGDPVGVSPDMARNVKNAPLVHTKSLDEAFSTFIADQLEALAGLRPRLTLDLAKVPGARILDGQFMAVQQAIGTARANAAGAASIRDLVETMKASGNVASLIEKHKVRGLSVAPKA